MTLPDVNFEKIRLHKGSQDKAFEELCCQLAALEEIPEKDTFYRKGPGKDAGVECFVRLTDTSEIGWQVKYSFQFDKNLETSLSKSIEAALKKHPDLTKYIVCLPFDFSDARGKKDTPLQSWEKWKKHWIDEAAQDARVLTIELWGESELKERLGRDNPLYSGRVMFWFDIERFDAKWFAKHHEKSCADLGKRYTPETSVDLPLRRSLRALSRDQYFNDEIKAFSSDIERVLYRAISSIDRLAEKAEVETPSNALKEGVENLLACMKSEPIPANQEFPLEDYNNLSQEAYQQARSMFSWSHKQTPKKDENDPIDASSSARHYTGELMRKLDDFHDELYEEHWRLINAKQLLVFGQGGQGKSHLLADSASYLLGKDFPSILLLGSKFNDGELWTQILQELDLPNHYRAKDFLGALDASAQAVNSRAIIHVDALNERNGLSIWPHRLSGFLKDIESFPNVAVVLSCRTTYLKSIIPDNLDTDSLPRIEHSGFSSNQARFYLSQRGFVLPGSPNLMPEFTNPLFLKTCCDALEKNGENKFPKGLNGVTKVFDFYNSAVVNALNERMKLEPRRRYVERAIEALTDEYSKRGVGYMPVADAFEIVDKIYQAKNRDTDIISQLESEGLLSIEIIPDEKGEDAEFIRFTFDRFSDLAISSKLLNDFLNIEDVVTSFAEKTPLHNFICATDSYWKAGVIEAMSVQLPEICGHELIDVVPKSDRSYVLLDGFHESLLLRQQSCFSERTLQIAKKTTQPYAFQLILVSIATEPENTFNADYLHKLLINTPMPKRDAGWSAVLAKHGETVNSSVETLISWSLENGTETLDQEQARLCVITLSWFLSTTNRVIRDRATKALTAILSSRAEIALELIQGFIDVDDQYILDRVLAAIYGAILKGNFTDDTLSKISDCVYKSFFEDERPPINVLLRDHASGVIEYAKYRGCLAENIQIEKCRPPYKSPWPIEHVPDELIDSYKEDYNGKLFGDSIVSSCVNDGDFARYIIDHEVRKWSPALRGEDFPSDEDIYKDWHNEFQKNASKSALEAYDQLIKAKDKTSGQGPYAETPEMKAYKKAQDDFRVIIGDDAWEDYRVRGKTGRRTGQFHSLSGKASFDHGWARRWVCKRAHDLGWSDAMHGEFDKSDGVSRDRMGHHTERIGKKYQWLALFELIARMSDNLAYISDGYEDDPEDYEGAWQTGLRDIDPSLSMTKTKVGVWDEFESPSWWVPYVPNLVPMEPLERLYWRDSKDDIICDTSLIDLKDSSGGEWLNLSTSCLWRQNRSENGDENLEKKVHFSIDCIVVEKKNFQEALNSLTGTSIYDSSFLPKISYSSSSNYIGEYCWHPAFSRFQKDICTDQYKIPIPAGATTASYLCERDGYDYSIKDSVSVNLPAPWLIRTAKLLQKNETQITYVNDKGETQFFDPSVSEDGYRSSLVKKGTFLRALEKENLEAIWIVNLSKEIFGGRQMILDFGGRFDLTGVFYIQNGQFKGQFHENWDLPSKEQLTSMLGEEPPADSPVREEVPEPKNKMSKKESEEAYKNLLKIIDVEE